MFGFGFLKKKQTDGASASKSRPETSKKVLGTFEVERELGRGAMGIVFLGRDTVSGREVAIKTMTIANEFNQNDQEDAGARFMREARILTWLDHPDIVTIYDVGEENGLAYIAMELLTGAELEEFCKEGRLMPVPQILDIMARVADALGYAHEQDIVHRDVKPANIMFDAERNMVKVADFGISRLTNLSATRVGLVLGSAPYMSPEQVMGKQIEGQSDIFSLGTTFYQLLSSRLPFEDNSEFNIMCRIVKEPHIDILSFRPDLPAGICAILDRALAKDLESRYQTGYEMAEDIRRYAATL